jgi:hypothetical protein
MMQPRKSSIYLFINQDYGYTNEISQIHILYAIALGQTANMIPFQNINKSNLGNNSCKSMNLFGNNS